MEAYRQYGPPLVRKAERILRNAEDARDVVHAVFLDLLQKNETNPELPYLYRAVTNRCLNVLRDRSCQARLLASCDPSLVSPVRSSFEERAISFDVLIKLSRELSGEQAELLVFRYLDDMSQDEIADITGKSRKTVGKHLSRVQEALQRLCAPEGDHSRGAA